MCNAHKEVTSLSLDSLGLSGGTLPTELGQLTTLTSVRGARPAAHYIAAIRVQVLPTV